MSNTEVTGNGGHGVLSFQQSFVNFFDPPSTIEMNGLVGGDDVHCDGGSGLFATATQISTTKKISLVDCQNDFGAPIF